MIFSTFPELSEAYDLKELYRRMNKDCSYDEAVSLYDDVLQAFKSSSICQSQEESATLTVLEKGFFMLYPRMFSMLYHPP